MTAQATEPMHREGESSTLDLIAPATLASCLAAFGPPAALAVYLLVGGSFDTSSALVQISSIALVGLAAALAARIGSQSPVGLGVLAGTPIAIWRSQGEGTLVAAVVAVYVGVGGIAALVSARTIERAGNTSERRVWTSVMIVTLALALTCTAATTGWYQRQVDDPRAVWSPTEPHLERTCVGADREPTVCPERGPP